MFAVKISFVLLFSIVAGSLWQNAHAQCSCIGCTDTDSVSVLSDTVIEMASACASGYASISKLNIKSTDGSTFEVYVKANSNSLTYYNYPSQTVATTCFNLGATWESSVRQLVVVIDCENYVSDCPVVYDIDFTCTSAAPPPATIKTCGSYRCPSGYTARSSSLQCLPAGTDCITKECCDVQPATVNTCSSYRCPSGYSAKSGSTPCLPAGSSCSSDECCDENTAAPVSGGSGSNPAPSRPTSPGSYCTCQCCSSAFCSPVVAGYPSVSDASQCGQSRCASSFPGLCPSEGSNGVSMASGFTVSSTVTQPTITQSSDATKGNASCVLVIVFAAMQMSWLGWLSA